MSFFNLIQEKSLTKDIWIYAYVKLSKHYVSYYFQLKYKKIPV